MDASWAIFLFMVAIAFKGQEGRAEQLLPDFVGFSYSRADVKQPESNRFVSFLNENLNINANFLPRYSSFQANRAGVYSFNFAFLSPRGEATVLALRKNGNTLVTALSEAGGLNPVSQAALTYLQPGDVVQLEIVQGRVDEGTDRSYTSFSGWLIGPTFDGLHPPGPGRQSPDNCDCCCQSLPLPTARPPYPPPSFVPPVIGPPAPPPSYVSTSKPNYIVTTTPNRDWSHGRQDPVQPTEELNCCDSLLISATSPQSPALAAQDEKFGVYRLQYVDRSPRGQGRATFKHIDRDLFLYYVSDSQVSGWIIGPKPGVSLGGLFIRSLSLCVEHSGNNEGGGEAWQYYDRDLFVRDPSVSVSCFTQGYLDGKSNNVVLNGKTHYHHHRHFHYHEPRALEENEAPSYNVRANSKYVEATFLYPQANHTTTNILPSVIEAKKEGFLSSQPPQQLGWRRKT